MPERHGSLLVVGLSDGLERALITRAARVAEAMHLAVYCYQALAHDAAPPAVPGIPAALTGTAHLAQAQQTREIKQARAEQALDAALALLRDRGIEADGLAEWRVPRVAAALAKAEEISPRLVMTAAEPHGRLTEVFGSDHYLELVRRCASPVWVVRDAARDGSVVLAAADPMHDHEAPCAVDHAVLDEATAVARALGKRAHVIHTYTLPTRLGSVLETTAPEIAQERYEQADDRHTRRLHELARAHGIRPEHTAVVQGEFVQTIRDLTETLDVALVVTGTLPHSRIERLLVGGTAEKLLRAIEIDVLVVKGETAGQA